MPGTGSLALEARDQVIDLQPLSLHINIHVFAFVYGCDVVPILALIIIRLQLHLCRNQQDNYLMAITATHTRNKKWLAANCKVGNMMGPKHISTYFNRFNPKLANKY